MSGKTRLVNAAGEPWFSFKPFQAQKPPTGDEVVPVFVPYEGAFGTFRTATRSSAGTTTVVDVNSDQNVKITDIMLSATKVNGATVSIQFSDGTNTEILFTIALTNQPVTFPWPVKGRVQGWAGSDVELVTVNATVAFVTVSYLKLPSSLTFAEWDALR